MLNLSIKKLWNIKLLVQKIINKCYNRNSNFDEICRNILDNDNVGYQQIVEGQCLRNDQMIDKSKVKVICSPLYRNGVYLYPPGSRVSECIRDNSEKLIKMINSFYKC